MLGIVSSYTASVDDLRVSEFILVAVLPGSLYALYALIPSSIHTLLFALPVIMYSKQSVWPQRSTVLFISSAVGIILSAVAGILFYEKYTPDVLMLLIVIGGMCGIFNGYVFYAYAKPNKHLQIDAATPRV